MTRPHFLRQTDTKRADECCTGMCEQGRNCPLVPRRLPEAPKKARIAPAVSVIFIVIVAVLCAVAIVDLATRVGL